MKKILIVHNKYRFLGGEDIAVQNEIKLLEKHYIVKTLFFNNKEINFLIQFFSFLINRNLSSNKIILNEIDSFKPDVIYIHNTWFKVSLGIFNITKNKNVKTILKLHNFRYDCTRSYLLKNHIGKKDFCLKCGLNKDDSLLFNKYFKDSILKSLLIIRYGKKYFKILKNNNISIVVLTKFHKEFLIDIGIDSEKISILPNYSNHALQDSSKEKSNFILYAGRISEEKGVEDLISSFLNSKMESLILKIVGEGPNLNFLKAKYRNDRIEFLGSMPNEKVLRLIEKSTAIVTATKLFEGQPTLLYEASLLKKPSIFPDSGGIKEFFPENYKYMYQQFNYKDLENKINLLGDKELVLSEGVRSNKYILNYLNEKNIVKRFESIINGR